MEYELVIQFGHEGRWSDESRYPLPLTEEDRKILEQDYAEYLLAHRNRGATRIIKRKKK